MKNEAEESSRAEQDGRAAEERVLRGLGVSPGVAAGPGYVTEHGEVPVPEFRLDTDEQVAAERERFAAAVATSVKQLRKLKSKSAGLPEAAAEEMGYLLDAH